MSCPWEMSFPFCSGDLCFLKDPLILKVLSEIALWNSSTAYAWKASKAPGAAWDMGLRWEKLYFPLDLSAEAPKV